MGARIIEKHFTLSRNRGGPDDSFSIEPDELVKLCLDTTAAWEALGAINYARKSSERDNLKFRRSLYFVRSMRKGDVITELDIRSIRPGYGLPPKMYRKILGMKVSCQIEVGMPVTFDSIETD